MESEFSEQLISESYEILISRDSSSIATFFSNLSSSLEPVRFQSYLLLNCCKKHHASLLFLKLYYFLRFSPWSEMRSTSLTILRYIKVEEIWSSLSQTVRENLKAEFLLCLEQENHKPNLKNLCCIVSAIACAIYKGDDRWQELIDYLVDSLQLRNGEKIREAMLLIITNLPQDCKLFYDQGLISSLELLHRGLLSALASSNVDVQVSACGAMRSLVGLFSTNSKHDLYVQLIDATTGAVYEFLKNSQEYNAQRIITELLVFVTDHQHALISSAYLKSSLSNMMSIMEIQQTKGKIESLIIQFLINVAETKKLYPILRELQDEILPRLFIISARLLFCIGDDIAYAYGTESLSRFTIAFGEKRIVPVAFKLFRLFMDSQDWQKRHAAVTTLSIIAKECSNEMILSGNFMEQGITMILKFFRDLHPQVCYAAFKFMQLHVDFVGAIRILHHTRIFPALVVSLGGNHSTKVKDEVIAAMLDFIKNTNLSILIRHIDVDDLLTKLLTSLETIYVTLEGKRNAFCLINIITQHCNNFSWKHLPHYIKALLEACFHDNFEIKQEVIHGIGIFAQFGGLQFQPFVSESILKLSSLLKNSNHPQAEDSKISSRVVLVLGIILEFHSSCIVDSNKLVLILLNHMPVKDNSIEARNVRKLLCLLVEKKIIIGLRFLPKITAIFVEVVNLGNDSAEGETIRRMIALLKKIWHNLPDSVQNVVGRTLNEQQRASLKSIVFQ